MSRNYAAEMRLACEEEMLVAPIAAVAACNVVERLLDEDRDLLEGFLYAVAIDVVRNFIVSIDRSRRAKTRSAALRTAFAEAAGKGEAERAKALQPFLDVRYVVDDEHTRMRLLDMRKEHLVYAATSYEDRARTNLMEASFLRALSKRVGDKTVGEYFSVEQLARLRNSIHGVSVA